MADRWVEAVSRFDAETARGFEAVRRAIDARGQEILAIPGVLGLRSGFRFVNGWITDEPAVVVTVLEKLPPSRVPDGQLIPRSLDGVPVDVAPATPLEQLRSEARSRGTGALPGPMAGAELALPDWEHGAGAVSRGDLGRAATRPYTPPPGLPLVEFVAAATVTCHASPDAGWTTLGPFLSRTRDRLTVGMYDFSAPHILAGLRDAMTAAAGPLRLVLDPALTLSRGTDPNRPKALDVSEEEVRDALERALGDRFTTAWAAVKRSGKTTGGIFPSAYHIKVAVRDGESFWLSSGNWQSSNQPDPARTGPEPDPADLLRVYNREWHVVVDHPGLAGLFERFLEHDLAEALPFQSLTREAPVALPDVLVPADDEPKPRGLVRFFEPVTFTFTDQNPARIQPLLTPDNYARHVVEVIRSARRSLYFQNQYISIHRAVAPEFLELVEALSRKVDEGIDVRIILRDGGDARAMLETLKAQGFRTDRIRLHKGCHTKGIVVDSRVVVLGSHNWSSDGTTANRDASLVISNAEVAAYYEALFLHDWENLARARVGRDRQGGQPVVARSDAPTPTGMARVSWADFAEELDESQRQASLALASGVLSFPPAPPRPELPPSRPKSPAVEAAGPSFTPGSGMIYALLVGIDDYPPPVPKLGGSVNDVQEMKDFLESRIDTGGRPAADVVKVKTLLNRKATREAFIRAFRTHLGRARSGDVALFCYSGHGSQEQAPPEFWPIEPDRLDETLVLHDSRTSGSWDLADKELAKLIGEVSSTGAHVVVLLDCCHAGSGTRDPSQAATAVRRVETDRRKRPIGSFIFGPDELPAPAPARGAPGRRARRAAAGRHVLLAACRDDEEAREYLGGGTTRGAFSYFLGETLRNVGGITYLDLFARASALVRGRVQRQSPQLEATVNDDLKRPFLGGAIRPAPRSFVLEFREGRWSIDAGRVHGIPAVTRDDAPRLALFDFKAPDDDLKDPARALAEARVTKVLTASSWVELDEGTIDPSAAPLRAVISHVPTPRMRVGIEGDHRGVAVARQAMAASLFVREAAPGEAADYRLEARGNHYLVSKPDDDRPLVGQVAGFTPASAAEAVARLEHIERWKTTAELDNPGSSIKPGELEVEFLRDGEPLLGPEFRLEYARAGSSAGWVCPELTIRLRNAGKRTLHVGLLDLPETFGIFPMLRHVGCQKLEPGQETFANDGEPVEFTVPDEYWEKGVGALKDVIKVVVATTAFNVRLMEQPDLDMPRDIEVLRGADFPGTLERLMRRVQTRHAGAGPARRIDDWRTLQFTFTTVRPLPARGVEPGRGATLTEGVRIEPHRALRVAEARVTSLEETSRALSALAPLPRLLYDDPAVVGPFELAATRSIGGVLNALELTGVNDPSLVRPTDPLRVVIPRPLAVGEHLLPVGFDGEFFLPLGRAESVGGETHVVLERLPNPGTSESRALGGALRVVFQKVNARPSGAGGAARGPLLAAVRVGHDFQVESEHDPAEVRALVQKARTGRIALLVHGILRDTRAMAAGLRRAGVAGRYDLILTFDYEDLHDPVAATALALKARLEAVGLGPGSEHGKALDVVAHSTGGLVARWFVECEGGHQVVRRLVLVGTPNGGLSWRSVREWATTALAVGLNELSRVAWPSSELSSLVRAVEAADVRLEQSVPGSDFLRRLNASPDPGVPYILIAGNTSLTPETSGGDARTVQRSRMLARLWHDQETRALATESFSGPDNDTAVSVASACDLPAARVPAPQVRTIACDHLSYFRDPVGLDALGKALS